MSGKQQLITDSFQKQKGPATRSAKRLQDAPKPGIKKGEYCDWLCNWTFKNGDVNKKQTNIFSSDGLCMGVVERGWMINAFFHTDVLYSEVMVLQLFVGLRTA